jgi:hypothetical protein
MSIPDLITQFCTSQAILASVVSEQVIEFPSDKERYAFIHSDNLIRLIVAVADATGLNAGMRVEFRFDMQANLNSGDQIVAGASRVLTVDMLKRYSQHYFRINPMFIPEGFDFAGIYFDVLGTNGGAFSVNVDLVHGAEKFDLVAEDEL